MKHFVGITDETPETFIKLIKRSEFWKKSVKKGNVQQILGPTKNRTSSKVIAMIFQKPSTRTRVSCEMALHHLGGRGLYLSPNEIGLGKREATKDVAAVLGRLVDGILARVFSHSDVLELSKHAGVPVVNGLSDAEHPCQILGDFLTMLEHGWRPGKGKLAFIGDGNNVCNSLIAGAALTGTEFVWVGPKGYEPDKKFVEFAYQNGGKIILSNKISELKGSDFIYNDVWTSMGFEDEANKRRKKFKPYQMNSKVMELVPSAKILHCLPAHRGEEITDEVIDGKNSIVLDQAENRVYSKMAVFERLFCNHK
ncbi:MAG: ornithine carbamoyltransferase [Candidatus Hydrogenedentes bacterium CG07_land_8_20_14_0_80_42_17]|nr:MAG: ornithine carbamoyltransferase [Candidatus Hydrogenedentes bacterium CG07_land_8_20_14_0_80_42_17]